MNLLFFGWLSLLRAFRNYSLPTRIQKQIVLTRLASCGWLIAGVVYISQTARFNITFVDSFIYRTFHRRINRRCNVEVQKSPRLDQTGFKPKIAANRSGANRPLSLSLYLALRTGYDRLSFTSISYLLANRLNLSVAPLDENKAHGHTSHVCCWSFTRKIPGQLEI